MGKGRGTTGSADIAGEAAGKGFAETPPAEAQFARTLLRVATTVLEVRGELHVLDRAWAFEHFRLNRGALTPDLTLPLLAKDKADADHSPTVHRTRPDSPAPDPGGLAGH